MSCGSRGGRLGASAKRVLLIALQQWTLCRALPAGRGREPFGKSSGCAGDPRTAGDP